MANVKLGRLARIHDPRVPRMGHLMSGIIVPPPPPSRDWTVGMPKKLGMMLNDQLGDCTCAAVHHARQVWTFNAGPKIRTATNALVLKLYEEACGYVPGDPATDQGGVEQSVLTYWLRSGVPISDGLDHLAAFVEIDVATQVNLQHGVNDGGVVYVGFNVPNALVSGDTVPAVWDYDPSADNSIVGGHAVVFAGYDENGFKLISWGQTYYMTWAFWRAFGDEAYMLANKDWIEKSGQTPSWFSLQSLEAQMQALKQ